MLGSACACAGVASTVDLRVLQPFPLAKHCSKSKWSDSQAPANQVAVNHPLQSWHQWRAALGSPAVVPPMPITNIWFAMVHTKNQILWHLHKVYCLFSDTVNGINHDRMIHHYKPVEVFRLVETTYLIACIEILEFQLMGRPQLNSDAFGTAGAWK